MKKIAQLAREGKIDEDASLTDRQSIIINAPIEKVWNHLVDTEKWPEWHDEVNWVKVSEDDPYVFSWQQANRTFRSSLEHMKAPGSLSWTAQSRFIKSIYLWQLDPTEVDQTVVTIQQSSQGYLLFMFMNHRRMHGDLLSWLDKLKKVAEESSALV